MYPTDGASRTERLLLVEDDEFSAQLIAMYLEKAGFSDVTIAADGRRALELAKAERFDLILLDLDLPKLSGTEVLRRLSRGGMIAGTPVVITSSLNNIEEMVHCIDLGADDFIPKPFNTRLLSCRVSNCLERSQLAARLRREEDEAARTQAGIGALAAAMARLDLPAPGPPFPVTVAGALAPSSPSAGGGWIDALALPDGTLWFAVGAVAGEGVPAILRAAQTRMLLRGALRQSPGESLAALNDALCDETPLALPGSLLLGHLDPAGGELRIAAAGEAAAWVAGASGIQPAAAAHGPPLGTTTDAGWDTETRRLTPGDGLFAWAGRARSLPAAEAQPLVDRLEAWAGGPPQNLIEDVRTDPDLAGGLLALQLMKEDRP